MILESLNRVLSKASMAFLIGLSVTITGLVTLVDYYFGPEITMSLFYLVPVAMDAWYVGAGLAAAFSFIASLLVVIVQNGNGWNKHASVTMLWNVGMHLGFFLVVSYLLTKLKQRLDMEKSLARLDHLTGLLNRRAFIEQFELIFNLSSRQQSPLTIAYIDLDNFKHVNDNHGHDAGDTVLQSVASAIKKHCRRTDLVARLGGDEFAVVLPDTAQEAARITLAAMHVAIQEAYSTVYLGSCSIGAVTFDELPKSVDQAIAVADQAMYEAKGCGKNNIAFHKFMT